VPVRGTVTATYGTPAQRSGPAPVRASAAAPSFRPTPNALIPIGSTPLANIKPAKSSASASIGPVTGPVFSGPLPGSFADAQMAASAALGTNSGMASAGSGGSGGSSSGAAPATVTGDPAQGGGATTGSTSTTPWGLLVVVAVIATVVVLTT
jgi:hypothetical protein